MRNSILFLLLIASLVISGRPVAADCPTEDVATLLARTRNIVLADVISLDIQGADLEYEIEVAETIKGAAPRTFVLRLPIATPGSPTERMKRLSSPHRPEDVRALHHGAGFWFNKESSGMVDGASCSGFFELRRGRYLMFLDEPHNPRAFEPIPDLDDPWYKTVKAMVSDPSIKGRAIDPIAFLRMFDSIYLAQCLRSDQKPQKPRLVFGRDRIDEFDPAVWFTQAPSCKAPTTKDVFHLVLLRRQSQRISVEIDSGVLRFAERYEDFVLTERTISLQDALRSLGEN